MILIVVIVACSWLVRLCRQFGRFLLIWRFGCWWFWLVAAVLCVGDCCLRWWFVGDFFGYGLVRCGGGFMILVCVLIY